MMKRIPTFLKGLFSPKELHNLDVQDILLAMSDASVRKIWLYDLFEELKRLNLEVDKRLLSDSRYGLEDLATRRKAFQDVLEGVLTARRQAKNHNPASEFDAVTEQLA